MLRRKARRVQGADDPLDAAQERRVRAVLALGGVPQARSLIHNSQPTRPRRIAYPRSWVLM
ncbi:hypothetical protein ACFV1D_56480, partial [Streptomyces mirabilis]